jgi:hypothetical protein
MNSESATNRAPSRLAQEVSLAGHKVFEAFAVSEALYVCERERVDVIVIASDIEDPDLAEAQLHHITIKLKPEATTKDILWELSTLFPVGPRRVR